MVAAARQGYGISGNFSIFVIIGSALITLSTLHGFKTLDRLAMVAVPLVGVILIAVCVTALGAGPTSLEPVRHPPVPMSRSEEHTSELQSLMRISYAVFCLKKKKQTKS